MEYHGTLPASNTSNAKYPPLYHQTVASMPQDPQWAPVTNMGSATPNGYPHAARTANASFTSYNLNSRQQPTPEPIFQTSTQVSHNFTPASGSNSAAVQYQIHAPAHQTYGATSLNQPAPQVEHATILLTLAEEYLDAAYGIVASPDARADGKKLKQYYRLIATALGCMETVLEKCRLDPHEEVVVRLRYATVLFDETENGMEAEEHLGKAISIADRHKLFDLRYNAQHLLVRMLYNTRPSAAFKCLDRILVDAEAYEHFDWVYAFGFLKVSLHMQDSPSRNDASSSITMLNRLMSLAESLGDTAILATAATQKAWICLRTSVTNDSLEEAQTSLAIARRLQGSRASADLLPVIIMIAIVDLCCCLQQSEPEQALSKLRHLEGNLSALQSSASWLGDGTFHVPLRSQRTSNFRSWLPTSVVQKSGGNFSMLTMNWLSKGDVSTVTHLLSCLTCYHQPKSSPQRAEEMLQRALQRQSYDQSASDELHLPLPYVMTSHLVRQQRSTYVHLLLGFILCTCSKWAAARESLDKCRTKAFSWNSIPKSLHCMLDLLAATIAQAMGDLNDATAQYRLLVQQSQDSHGQGGNLINDCILIASLNHLLVMGLPDSSDVAHGTASAMFDLVTKICPTHPNRQIQAAYHLVHSTQLENATFLGRKQTLQLALNAAKASHSSLELCMALCIMNDFFFTDQITEQAEKSARAAHTMSRKVNNKIWTSAAARILAGHFEKMGRPDEAESALREGWEAAEALPHNVQKYLGWYKSTDTHVEMSFV